MKRRNKKSRSHECPFPCMNFSFVHIFFSFTYISLLKLSTHNIYYIFILNLDIVDFFYKLLNVIKLDVNLIIGAQGRINICYLICLRHLIRSRAVTNRIFFIRKRPILLDAYAKTFIHLTIIRDFLCINYYWIYILKYWLIDL